MMYHSVANSNKLHTLTIYWITPILIRNSVFYCDWTLPFFVCIALLIYVLFPHLLAHSLRDQSSWGRRLSTGTTMCSFEHTRQQPAYWLWACTALNATELELMAASAICWVHSTQCIFMRLYLYDPYCSPSSNKHDNDEQRVWNNTETVQTQKCSFIYFD